MGNILYPIKLPRQNLCKSKTVRCATTDYYGCNNVPDILKQVMESIIGSEKHIWLDDLLKVSRGSKSKHLRRCNEILQKNVQCECSAKSQ